MHSIAIVKKELNVCELIKDKLIAREAEVNILLDINDLKNNKSSTLICSDKIEKDIGGSNNLLALARQAKINKIIIINDSSKSFKISKELGGALIRVSCKNLDNYVLEIVLINCLDNQKFVAGSKATYSLMNLARRVSLTDVTVFINGPTGTGKEVVANYIHEKSNRKDKPFVAVNCAAIPENMLEAMLFGHEKGSFTGASQSNKGIFRAADGGTLLLDEISEMPLSLQAKLLRVLQERKVTPVGGTRDIDVDIRVIATTNRNMPVEVRENRFREDLYYRLNVFPIRTSNLSDRIEDIIPIATAIIMKQLDSDQETPYLSSAAQDVLLNHRWGGNVRELENVIQRSLVLYEDDIISAEHIMIDDSLDNKELYFTNNLEEKLALASSI